MVMDFLHVVFEPLEDVVIGWLLHLIPTDRFELRDKRVLCHIGASQEGCLLHRLHDGCFDIVLNLATIPCLHLFEPAATQMRDEILALPTFSKVRSWAQDDKELASMQISTVGGTVAAGTTFVICICRVVAQWLQFDSSHRLRLCEFIVQMITPSLLSGASRDPHCAAVLLNGLSLNLHSTLNSNITVDPNGAPAGQDHGGRLRLCVRTVLDQVRLLDCGVNESAAACSGAIETNASMPLGVVKFAIESASEAAVLLRQALEMNDDVDPMVASPGESSY